MEENSFQIKWDCCLICQDNDESQEVQPTLLGYSNVLSLLKKWKEGSVLPKKMRQELLDEILSFSASDLQGNGAVWHKLCRNKCDNLNLKRKLDSAKRMSVSNPPEKMLKSVINEGVPEPSTVPSIRTTRSKIDAKKKSNCCFFCGDDKGEMHLSATTELDFKVRRYASLLGDEKLQIKLAEGDLTAIDACYHNQCLVSLYNRVRHQTIKRSTSDHDNFDEESLAFARVVDYVRSECSKDLTNVAVFKLGELKNLYHNYLPVSSQENKLCDTRTNRRSSGENVAQNKLDSKSNIHSSRFKERLLNAIPYLSAYHQGRDVFFIADAEMGSIVYQAYEKRENEEAFAMLKCCKDVRQSVFTYDSEVFEGTFEVGCQQKSVPSALLSLVSLLLYGPKYTGSITQECLTISQIIKFNMKRNSRERKTAQRHSLSSETPIAIYIAFLLHSRFRSKQLIDILHHHGLTVSYFRILELEKGLLSAMCTQFNNDGVVCPTQLRLCIPTLCTIDNIDINPKSNTSKGSFHGTILSVLQTPKESLMGTKRPFGAISDKNNYSELPESYALVPAELTKVITECPINKNYTTASRGTPDIVMQPHNDWIDLMEKCLAIETSDDSITWRSFFKNRQKDIADDTLPGISSILPLFHEKAATPAMVKHAMDIFVAITNFLNPGQIPVCATDLPIYVLGKHYQWANSQKYGEDKFIWLLGGLHSEMAAWSMVGRFLTNSGWTGIISESDVATGGTSESLLQTTSLMKTRHAHTVTLMALELLQREAMVEDVVDFEKKAKWISERSQNNPTFMYWEITKNLELWILSAVRGLREKNLKLYTDSMEYVCYYFFSLDSTNYKRWMPVHIRDMRTLPEAAHQLFDEGAWVFSKTAEPFSYIPLDQANEHNVKVMKGSGGIVGLQQDPELLRDWAIVSPEVARIVSEFEKDCPIQKRKIYDEGPTAQTNFVNEVQQTMSAISKYGNPFLLETKDLMTLDSHDCADSPEIINVMKIHSTGEKQYTDYVTNVLNNGTVSINNKLKMNSMYIFQQKTPSKAKGRNKVKEMKLDFLLISKLLMACQTRSIDPKNLFSYENNSYPPSLSKNGHLNLPDNKSALLQKLDIGKTSGSLLPKNVDAHVFDGPGVMYCLKGKVSCKNTFADLRDEVFIPWLQHQLEHCARVDFVWDRYPSDSLKLYTRESRGYGRRRHVGDGIKIPIKMEEFLKNGDNKEDLFAYLSEGVLKFMEVPASKQLNITYKDSVITRGGSLSDLAPCDHEESDTRMLFHIFHAVKSGCKSLFLSTGDSDVVIIATYAFSVLVQEQQDLQVWILFGQGKSSSVYNVRKIYEFLGPVKCRALLFFVAFTGCDTTSQFAGKGKLSGWNAWLSYPEATNAFLIHPFENISLESERFHTIEKFVCILYSRTTNIASVNEMRENIFPKLEFSQLPPTQEALYQHVQRSVYQASIWLRCTNQLINAPTPTSYGWKRVDDQYEPLWTSLPPISTECNALLKCGCKSLPFCSKNCRCKKVWNLPCTPLCYCKGQCNSA